jgi:hypothetical protein
MQLHHHSQEQNLLEVQRDSELWRTKYNNLLEKNAPDKQSAKEFQDQTAKLAHKLAQKQLQVHQLLDQISLLKDQLRSTELKSASILESYKAFQEQITNLKL